jgi:large subunit ribosomal protein L17
VEVERIVEVEKIVEVERIVEVEKIVEVERIVEIVKSIDMNNLQAMMAKLSTVESKKVVGETRSVKEGVVVERREIETGSHDYIRLPEKVVEEVVVPVETVVEEPVIEAKVIRNDDLTIMEGIGPKIAGLLNNAGIYTFWQLANTEEEILQEILNSAGSSYQMHNPKTWAAQAALASDEKWDELNAWKEVLKGGK